MNKHLYATTPRYADFDKVSGKPLILTEQGNMFPTPYATMPMDDQVCLFNLGFLQTFSHFCFFSTGLESCQIA